MSECRSCGKPVRWAKTEKGKWLPLDIDPHERGLWGIVGGVALRLGHPDLADYDGPLYMAHWATCPHAQAHRRTKR